jgi:hypothetical protein
MRAMARAHWLNRAARCLPALLLIGLLTTAGVRVRAQQTAPAVDARQVKASVKDILSQPEFRPDAPDSAMAQLGRTLREDLEQSKRWINDRWKAIQRWLSRLFGSFGGAAAGAAASIFSRVFIVLFIAAGLCLVAWLARGLAIGRSRKAAMARTAFDEPEAEDGIVMEPDAWMQQAGAFAQSDDYRRAFRAVFIAILLLLDQGGLIEFDRSRTNGDYLRLLRRKSVPKLYGIIEPLVREFDRRWYGRAETGPDDYRRIRETLDRVRTVMSEPVVAPEPVATAPGEV